MDTQHINHSWKWGRVVFNRVLTPVSLRWCCLIWDKSKKHQKATPVSLWGKKVAGQRKRMCKIDYECVDYKKNFPFIPLGSWLWPTTPPPCPHCNKGQINRKKADRCLITCIQASLVAQTVKNLPAMQETQVRFLGWEDPLEKGMATHSSICLENSMDRRVWWDIVYGAIKRQTWLSNFTSLHIPPVYMRETQESWIIPPEDPNHPP